MTRAALLLGFALAVAAGTAALGWWMVPVLAAVRVRALPRDRAPVASCMAGAALGWALLLGWDAWHGPAGLVARRVGGTLGLGAWGFVLLTLIVPALLAGAAARVAKPSSLPRDPAHLQQRSAGLP
jgi:hypothetical protein